MLKMNPPIIAETMLLRSAAATLARNPSPLLPVEPSVKAKMTETRTMPIA